MTQVYDEAYLNIAGTASKNNDEDILDHNKSLHSRSTYFIDLAGPGISNKRCICYDMTPWKKYIQVSPWSLETASLEISRSVTSPTDYIFCSMAVALGIQ